MCVCVSTRLLLSLCVATAFLYSSTLSRLQQTSDHWMHTVQRKNKNYHSAVWHHLELLIAIKLSKLEGAAIQMREQLFQCGRQAFCFSDPYDSSISTSPMVFVQTFQTSGVKSHWFVQLSCSFLVANELRLVDLPFLSRTTGLESAASSNHLHRPLTVSAQQCQRF